jgi:hypothetical protein
MKFTEQDVIKAKALTTEAFKQLGIIDLDLSYITPELLELYEGAKEKDPNKCDIKDIEFGKKLEEELDLSQDYPCFIGHSPVAQANAYWVYQNNNSSDGCDNESHLCGSGYSWKARCSKVMKDRYCANGKKGFLGWPF